MVYVALLRGINVGGNNKVEMAKLKRTFERLGHIDVRTYINSGNIIFSTDKPPKGLVKEIEAAIENDFGFHVHVLLRNSEQMQAISNAIPEKWTNDKEMKTDVLFLWESVDKPAIIKELPLREGVDNAHFVAGAIVWNVSRKSQPKSGLIKMIGTPLYKLVTIRNANTTRKLCELMRKLEENNGH